MATAPNQDLRGDDHDLVEVFGSERESEVFVVKGLLEGAGIECMTRNFDAPQDILPGVGGVAIVEVHRAGESIPVFAAEAADVDPADHPVVAARIVIEPDIFNQQPSCRFVQRQRIVAQKLLPRS